MFELPAEYLNFIKKHKVIKLQKNTHYEKHHILPKSLEGDDSDENICYLTIKNHFLAHLLLAQKTNNSTCWKIVFMMINVKRKYIPKSYYKKYEEIRKNSRESLSIVMKNRWKNEEYQMFMKKIASEAWKKEGYRENRKNKMEKYYKNEEYIKNMSKKSKDRWKESEYRSKCIKNIERTPERIKNQKEKIKKTLSTKEAKELKSKTAKLLWKNPEYRKKVSDGLKRYHKNRRIKNDK